MQANFHFKKKKKKSADGEWMVKHTPQNPHKPGKSHHRWQDQKGRMKTGRTWWKKLRVIGRIYGMKYSWKDQKCRNRHMNRIKRSGQAQLIYVFDINHNIPTSVKESLQGEKECIEALSGYSWEVSSSGVLGPDVCSTCHGSWWQSQGMVRVGVITK